MKGRPLAWASWKRKCSPSGNAMSICGEGPPNMDGSLHATTAHSIVRGW